MKKYIFLIGTLATMLIALTACQDIYGLAVRHAEPEREPAQEAYAQATTYDETVHTNAWQEAYATKLNYYAQQPAATATIEATEWRFILHDINDNGTPQLFLARYHDGLLSFYTAYSFEDGNAIRLKSALCVNALFDGGMYIIPSGTGVFRYFTTGFVSQYAKFEFSGASLARTVSGDMAPSVDSFRVNAFPVTEEEFENTFGRYDERIWLVLHEITETNIQDIIFGY